MKKIDSSIKYVNGACLDKKQLSVVTCKRKKILVLAGAGSGKTLIIVAKIRYLIECLKVNPKEILCVSFTNDAVLKLKKDLNIKQVEVLTFHKLALKIIGKRKEILSEDILKDVIIESFSNDKLFGLYEMNKNEMYLLVETFINLFKSNNYSLDKFYEFINKSNVMDKTLLIEIMKCYICYESYLNKENVMDFNDMINFAIKKVSDYKNRYKYVIIDEYQDISFTKLLLIKKILKLSNAKLLVVGDDFQSIYRFSGSDVKLITNFRKYFPFSKTFKLKMTYRNADSLIKLAGKFIMKNPNQIKKKLKSNNNDNDVMEVVFYDDLNEKINQVIKEDQIDELFILSRNNRDLLPIKVKINNYKKLTVHKSKGLQSKYVFLINMSDETNGFPSKHVDHKILRYVNNYKEYYPYEEERRLFYVAMTRCKKKVYFFVPKGNPSIFIKEILKMNKNINIRKNGNK